MPASLNLPGEIARRGAVRGLRLYVTLLQVMIPAYAAVSILKATGFLGVASRLAGPLMRLVGLPPQTAVPLVVAFCTNIYAGIGAMQPLGLTMGQTTQIAVVMLIAHNLIVEVGIVARLRTRWLLIGLFRIGMGLAMGALFHYAFGFNAGEAVAAGPMVAAAATAQHGLAFWQGEAISLWHTLFKTFCVVLPLLTAMEFLRAGPWLDRLTSSTVRPLRSFGLERESVLPFWAGVILGIAYGAGLMIDAAENDNFGGRQAFLVSVFLGVCHSVIEDTLLFVAIGASLFWILVPRIAAASLLTWACARVLRMFSNHRGTEAQRI